MTQARTFALATILTAGFLLTGCAATPTISTGLTETALDLTVEDDAMGHVVEISGIVRNFTYPGQTNAESMEIVLVDVTATAGTEYTATWGPSDTVVRDASGENFGTLMATGILAAMDADGFTTFEADALEAGETGSGWIPYGVTNARTATLDFVTEHLGTKIMDGPTIEAEEYSVRVAG